MGVGCDLLSRVNAQPPDQQPSDDGAPKPPSILDGVLADLQRPAAPAVPPVVKPSLPKPIPPVSKTGIGASQVEPPSPRDHDRDDTPPLDELPEQAQQPQEVAPIAEITPAPPKTEDGPLAASDPLRGDQEPDQAIDEAKSAVPDDARDEFPDKDLVAPGDVSEQPSSTPELQQPIADDHSDTAESEEPHIQPALVAPPHGRPPLPEVPPRDDAKSNRSTQWALIGTALLIFFNIALIAFIAFILFGRDQTTPPPTTELPPVTRPAPARPAEPAPPPAIEEKPDLVPVVEERPEQPAAPSPTTFTIPKLELIRGISGFGQYDRLPDAPLRPRHLPHIQAYVEMTNLTPEPREDGRFNYYVSMRVKMYRADIGPSEPLMDTTISHVFRGYSPRRDFHLTHALQSSRPIRSGEHVVAVRVVDQITRSVAQEQTSFVITSEP